MNPGEALDIARDSLLMVLQIGGPIMIAALIVGLAVSVLQALTQIQEMTLTFVPKIIVIFIALIVMLPFMLSSLVNFTEGLFGRISAMGL